MNSIDNILKKLRESRMHESKVTEDTYYEMDDEAKVSKIESDVEEAISNLEDPEDIASTLAALEAAEDQLYDLLDATDNVNVVRRAKAIMKKIRSAKGE